MQHPYKSAPTRAFWSRAVAQDFNPHHLLADDSLLIADGEAVMSAGSCFAANIVPYLERAGIRYVWAERPHPALAHIHKEALSYHKFSAAYGNIYTARHLLQLLQRATGSFSPKEDRWYEVGDVIDPFRPGLAFPASSDAEFDALTRQHLDRVLQAIEQADVFVFTLGLTEGWVSKLDGATFPACPGTVRGTFDAGLHEFHNFSVADIGADLLAAFNLMRKIKRRLRFIVTVSPVPLVATATPEHVLSATIYSKSVLRVCAQEITTRLPGVTYFPAYEIVTGPQAPWNFFEADRREPSQRAIMSVMDVLLARCVGAKSSGVRISGTGPALPSGAVAARGPEIEGAAGPGTTLASGDAAGALAAALATMECEEAGAAM
jgi:hypothetical protein